MSNPLLARKEKEYGGKYKDHFFEQYKIFIDSIEKTSDRRQQANNYFLAINTALISLIGFSLQVKIFGDFLWPKALIAFLGIIISVIFWYLIRSYKQLNTGKFVVVHEIEELLPLRLYKHEWEILGKGKDKSRYYPFSHIELLIPWVFGLIYTILLIYFLCN